MIRVSIKPFLENFEIKLLKFLKTLLNVRGAELVLLTFKDWTKTYQKL